MNTDRTVAFAQILLSVVYTAGYFMVLQTFLDGEIKTPPEWKDVLATLISLLTAGELLMIQFWFSRARPTSTAQP